MGIFFASDTDTVSHTCSVALLPGLDVTAYSICHEGRVGRRLRTTVEGKVEERIKKDEATLEAWLCYVATFGSSM